MLRVYAAQDSSRLRYILDWVLLERLGIAYTLCRELHNAQLVYADCETEPDKLRILPQGILSQKGHEMPALSINRWRHTTVLFYNQPRAEINFDLLAAAFFLVSRYEEYGSICRDAHGRFPSEASVAAQFSFLQQPVLDVWIMELGKILRQKFGLMPKPSKFALIHTYDNDLSWKYLHKPGWKQKIAAARDMVLLRPEYRERRQVLAGRKGDPFQCFDKIAKLHQQYQMPLQIFVLAGGRTAYDANTTLDNPAMAAWLIALSRVARLSLHPSYDTAELKAEHDALSMLLNRPITASRQHYIRLALPSSYRALIVAGITEDYTMGYPDANGFRAGTSHSFPWYDLEGERTTVLRIHPFCYMDACSLFYNRHNAKDAEDEWYRLLYALKKVDGCMISVWHNYILGDALRYGGWWDWYVRTFEPMQ